MEACWEALDELEELQRDYANSAGTLLEVEPELAVTLLVLVCNVTASNLGTP